MPGMLTTPRHKTNSKISVFVPLWFNWLCTKSGHTRSSLCNLCVLCASVVHYCSEKTTTETQSTQRLHREEAEQRLFVQSRFNFILNHEEFIYCLPGSSPGWYAASRLARMSSRVSQAGLNSPRA